MWVFRYAGLLFEWAFTHWRKHQAIGGLAVTLLIFLGVLRSGAQQFALYFGIWLAVLVLIVAPARLWRQHDLKGATKIRFIDHPDNRALENDEDLFLRVTVENRLPDAALTGVEVVLVSIMPKPDRFTTLSVPLVPVHANTTAFTLRPGFPRTVNLVSAPARYSAECTLWHWTPTVPTGLPDGEYRLKLVATANETIPAEKCATLKVRHELEAGGDPNNGMFYNLATFELTLDA